MIYLIGGAPRLGKSIAARAIAAATNSLLIETDRLVETVKASLAPPQQATTFPMPGFSADAAENTLSPEGRIELQLVESRSLEEAIDELVNQAVAERRQMVVEGVHLLPDYVATLLQKYGPENLHAVFVGSTDASQVLDGMNKNQDPNDWLKEADEAVRRQVAEFAAAFSYYLESEARKDDLPYFARTEDFEDDLKTIQDLLESSTPMTTVRPATAADLATLAVMQRKFYGEEFDAYHPDLSDAVAAAQVFVADHAGEIVGYLVIELFGPDQPNLPSSVFLSDLYVVPAVRSHGLGTRLIETALAAPWPAAYPRFTLTHDAAEPGLTAYYDRFGFKEIGVTAAGNVMMERKSN